MLVWIATRLKNSHRYQETKHWFRELLDDPKNPKKIWFDTFMVLLVLTSVAVIIFQVGYDLGSIGVAIEAFAVTVFSIEYLLRLWVFSDNHRMILEAHQHSIKTGIPLNRKALWREMLLCKWRYISSPFAIIDLLAILPMYRPLRFLRLILLFRLFKLVRYSRSLAEFGKVLQEKKFELYTLFTFMAVVLFASGVAIFAFERGVENTQIHSVFDGIYWALVTITTVGYGDIVPVTSEGKIITMILILSGLGVISFFTSTIVSGFSQKMGELHDSRVFAEIDKLKSFSLVCGYGRLGKEVCRQLNEEGIVPVIVEKSMEQVEAARRDKYLVICGDASSTQLMGKLVNLPAADSVLCLANDDITNLYITLTCRQINPQVKIIARVNRSENTNKLKIAGATYTINPQDMVSTIAVEYVGQPVAFEAIYNLLSGSESMGVEDLHLYANNSLIGRKLSSIDFERYKIVLIGILLNEKQHLNPDDLIYPVNGEYFYFNPGPDYILRQNDQLIVIAHYDSVVFFIENEANYDRNI